ncbi:MAG: serine hydrolase domain-containing protein [Lysobacteraceae bacterium]
MTDSSDRAPAQTGSANASIEAFLEVSPRPVLHGAVMAAGGTTRFAHGDAGVAQDAVFEIGSIGKLFTATLLALMVREGEVRLDDPVARFRPQYPFSRDVTLGQLASHTGGIDPNPVGGWTMLTRAQAVARDFRPQDLETVLRAHRLRTKRLGRFGYSNVGMALLGHILADCLGLDYGRAVHERVLVPLGMHDTRVDWTAVPGDRLVVGHDARGRPLPPFEWPGLEPAGVWRSTLEDMLRFVGAQLGRADETWSSLARGMIESRARVGADTSVGLGWMLSDVDRIGRVAWHSGGTFGQHAVIQWTPDAELGVVLLSNRRPPLWHHLLASRRLEDLGDRLMGEVIEGDGEPARA